MSTNEIVDALSNNNHLEADKILNTKPFEEHLIKDQIVITR